MITRVVHVKSKEWAETPEEERVYIGRAVPRRGFKAGVFANPFKIGRHGTRIECINLYEGMLKNLLYGSNALRERYDPRPLRGKVLGCWCKPEACHGDLLARLAEMSDEEYEEWLRG